MGMRHKDMPDFSDLPGRECMQITQIEQDRFLSVQYLQVDTRVSRWRVNEISRKHGVFSLKDKSIGYFIRIGNKYSMVTQKKMRRQRELKNTIPGLWGQKLFDCSKITGWIRFGIQDKKSMAWKCVVLLLMC